jgi:hypothetical protein
MNFNIDFVAGSHGNYLEFVLNKLVNGSNILQDSPFNKLGASHSKNISYYEKMIFHCDHWFLKDGCPNDNVISIKFTGDDLLSLMSVSLLRAGNMNISDNDLHINTFNKLNNPYYKSTLDSLRATYSDSIVVAYDNVKGENWPDIQNPSDFYLLPDSIQNECINDFGFKVNPLTAEYPDCDRYLLREFFKHGFKTPEINGFIVEQTRMQYPQNKKVFEFPYASFYNTELFLNEIQKIQTFFNLIYGDFDVVSLHNEFLSTQFQKDYKAQCDYIIDCIVNGVYVIIPKLSLFQESYINAKIELATNKIMPFEQLDYFTNTEEIIAYLNEI